MTSPSSAARIRPIEHFAKAVGKCTVESNAYGKCIFLDYNNITKGMCQVEFLRLKECVLRAVKK
ncbi:hypothetical protein FN846DRAFT_103896 [Sphaerosporella brunnea]|uniref:IMS import disulfide relay-system CHCH-CHCH-like Cx9C domain-containing protein n=1 Tax=Sphaerosporella brunnea TaxID=1250544 RepID=A0A5J5ERZ3_9PEZI|nr:hypothetical protein FN846DRAFT_103896 [Sphaerosporella brunnea]